MPKSRKRIWLALLAVPPILLIVAVAGLFAYMNATKTPIFATRQSVPSVTHAVPVARWAGAVEQARQIARASVVEQNLPGLSAAVGVNGEVVWAEGYGWENLENRIPVSPDTRFRIGTTSTALTSAAVGLLLEQHRLKLDDEIQTYVPAFPRKQWPVTVGQLMGHLSGVRNDAADEELLTARCPRTVDGLARFAARPLLFEPGTRFRYSSYGWILVSAAVEAAAGEPFFPYMRRRVFAPLGMSDTAGDAPTEPIGDRATSYFPRFAANPRYGPQDANEVDYSCFSGASAFLSTPSDLVRFGMAIENGTLLQPATVELLQTRQALASGKETGVGLGWQLPTVMLAGVPTREAGVDGTLMGGMVSSLMTFPEERIVVAVTANTPYADTKAVALKIAGAFAEPRKGPERK